MIEIVESEVFADWFARVRDQEAKDRILVRIRRMSLGNLGDVKPVGTGISEARIDYGAGYRLYFLMQGNKLIVLLCGGDKRSQDRDITKAKKLAQEWRAS